MNKFSRSLVLIALTALSNSSANSKTLSTKYLLLFNKSLNLNEWITKADDILNDSDKLKNAPEKNKELFVKQNLEPLTKYIVEFCSSTREYKKVVTPLVEESLETQAILTKFFNSNSTASDESIKTFLKQEVKDIDTFKSMCAEFITFFNDLNESLSDDLVKSKKLSSKYMILINIGIALDPTLLIKAWETKEVASDTIKDINKLETNGILKQVQDDKVNEKSYVQQNLDLLVAHLLEFSSYVRDYKKIIIPLVEESLNPQAIIARFFKSEAVATDASSRTFFNQEVKDINELKTMCTEFNIFFNDLHETLSARAKKSFAKGLINLA